MNPLKRYVNSFVTLLYPKLCFACLERTPVPDQILCTSCQYELTPTQMHHEGINPVVEKFWGRVAINNGAAMFQFTKTGKVQRLIHQLKYKGKQEIGLALGCQYGELLKTSPLFQDIDLIVPVPLHPKKLKLRGYNQSDLFAAGLSETLSTPWRKDALQRVIHSKSQTKKTREERFENVAEVFIVNESAQVGGQHILLVDDVLTTGATLEVCASKLLALPNTKVSIVVIALAT